MSWGQFLRSSNSRRYHWIIVETSCYDLKIRDLGANCAWRFYYFNFEGNYDLLKSKNPWILLNKNIKSNKTKRKRKWKISHTVLERRTFCFSSYKNRKLIVKLWELALAKEKRGHFLYRLFCLKEIFLRFLFYLDV